MEARLFESEHIADAWRTAGVTWAPLDDRLAALRELSWKRDFLPGAVFFTVPEGAEENGLWQELIAATLPYCDCKSRRVIYPGCGRTRLIQQDPPRLVKLRYDTTSAAAHQHSSLPLVIAPHGGDLASAYVSWSFWYQKVSGRQLPYINKPATLQPQLIHQMGITGVGHSYPEHWFADTSTIKKLVEAYGEVLFMQLLPKAQGKRWLPTCSIVGLGEGNTLEVTFEVDAAVCIIENVDSTTPLHVCTNDA